MPPKTLGPAMGVTKEDGDAVLGNVDGQSVPLRPKTSTQRHTETQRHKDATNSINQSIGKTYDATNTSVGQTVDFFHCLFAASPRH